MNWQSESSPAERLFFHSSRLVFGAVLLASAIAASAPFEVAHAGQTMPSGPTAQGARTDNPASGGEAQFSGSASCARCHRAISENYAKTAMGRSMSPATPSAVSNLSTPAHFSNPALNRNFEVFTQDGKLSQSEYAAAPDGTDIFRDTRQIEWLIGSGTNGFGPVVRQNNYLFQAPLSFYSKPRSWGPSPGYESLDLGFNRPIQPGCIFCHSGRANPVAGTNGQYKDPPFAEASIGCENCHGPGAAHVQAMSRPGRVSGKEAWMVDPARIAPYLSDNICMACHQTGNVRVLKPGKTYRDIVPGHPLDEALSILMVPPTPASPPDSDHVEHYYSMTLSKCYTASRGRMSCISCHDPHVQPSREEAPAYFAKKCLTCHTDQSCKLPLQVRQQKQPANDCAGCHMPKRDIQVISHSSATNHRILARPDEPFPESTFRQTIPALPDLIHLNPAPGQEKAPPPPLTLLAAYGELAGSKSEYVAPYLKVLSQLEQTQPENALVQASVGRRELKSGNYASAIDHLQRALKLAPPEATTCADLAEALSQSGRKEESLPWLEKAVELDPFNPAFQKSLIARLIDLRQYRRALAALEQYVQTFPQDEFMRKTLTRARTQPLN